MFQFLLQDAAQASWVQTIAILAAALAYVTKLTVDSMRKSKETKDGAGFLTQNQRDRYLSDLEKSHRPILDSVTGQPKYQWYGDTELLRSMKQELQDSRKEMTRVADAVEKLLALQQQNGRSKA